MNLQQILDPVAKLTDQTFRMILVPMSDPINWAVIALGLFGLVLWIRMQQSYTAKAKRDNTLI